jgi:xanthine/uracil/vitamin C permease (AzgA family)
MFDATTVRTRALGPALLGLVLVVLGTVGYFVAVIELGPWLPDLRNRALPNWCVIVAGLLLSFVAVSRASQGRKLLAIAILVLNVALTGLWATMLYVNFVVPPSHGPTIGARSADFALADPKGRVVHLADFAGKPLILVFYRGHW